MPSRPKQTLVSIIKHKRTSLLDSADARAAQFPVTSRSFASDKQAARMSLEQTQAPQEKRILGKLRKSYSVGTADSDTIEVLAMNIQKPLALKEVLQDTEALSEFRNFLMKEYSDENLDFWCLCEKYKKEKPTKRRKTAKIIFDTFVKENSPREINIDAREKTEILRNLDNPDESTFATAQDLVFVLMQRDSFPRFLTCQSKSKKDTLYERRRGSHSPTKSSKIFGNLSFRRKAYKRKSSV